MEKFVEMDDAAKTESHLTSAAAFVEGGIQEAYDDTCSICLEDFCESDPSTVTTCKHEFHLQCILEWCQRSSQCPMCWQPISLKDPSSQELLQAVESERNLQMAPARNTAIFHHPTLGNFELRHLPVGVNDADIEERNIQHLAAAAAMGRAHIGRREGQRGRPSSHGRPHFLVFTHPSRPACPGASREDNEPAVITVAGPSSLEVPLVTEPSAHIALHPSVQTDPISSSALGSAVTPENHHGTSSVTRSPVTSHPPTNLERAGPSEFQSFSESLKTKFNSVSMRYKESISNSTKGWKDKLFPRDTSMSELGSVVRREVNAINYISKEQYNELRASIESLGTGLEFFQSMYLFRQDQFETLIISQLEHLAAVIQNLHHRIDLTESNQSKAIDDVISSVRFHSSHLAAQLQRDFDKIITHIGDLSTLMTRSAGEPSHAVENLDENDENLEAARPATSTVPSSAEHLDVLLNTDVAVVAQDIGTDVAQEVALLEVEPVPAPPIEDTPMEDAGDAINADSVPPSSPVEEISHQAESPPNKDDFLDQLWDIMHWENLSSSEL